MSRKSVFFLLFIDEFPIGVSRDFFAGRTKTEVSWGRMGEIMLTWKSSRIQKSGDYCTLNKESNVLNKSL